MRVLICPLDWGLGHATRCVPIIREFLERNDEVFIASSGSALKFLQLEFPKLIFFELPGYQPKYSKKGLTMNMVRQIPAFSKVIRREHKIIRQLDAKHDFNLIISDNRYGCWSRKDRSIMITHQTRPVLPNGFGWASFISNAFLNMYLKNFKKIWIPDQPNSGMTEPFNGQIRQSHTYIGWLSRFSGREDVPMKYDVLAIVSGPEPQRTIFKNMMIDQLKSSGLKSLLVAGDPENVYREEMGMLAVVNHLPSAELEKIIQSSKIIVSRSGYSTIMDLIVLGKKAILVPTPGQTEQETLAEHFMKEKTALSVDQEKFSLKESIKLSADYSGFSEFKADMDLLGDTITRVRI